MTKINAESLAAAITAAVLAALRESDVANPAPKKAGKAADAKAKAPSVEAPAVEAPAADVADAISALRAEYRAAYGADWWKDADLKAEFNARKASARKPTAAGDSAPAKSSLALDKDAVLALKAKFRAEYGNDWHKDAGVKAKYDALRWVKKPTATAATEPAPAAKAAEGDLDGLGLRALQALRKEMGLKGAFSENAAAVREQIRGARAAAEPKAKAKAKGRSAL